MGTHPNTLLLRLDPRGQRELLFYDLLGSALAPSETLRVPRILHRDGAQGWALIERVQAPRLDAWLKRGYWRLPRWDGEALRQAGRFLATLHRVGFQLRASAASIPVKMTREEELPAYVVNRLVRAKVGLLLEAHGLPLATIEELLAHACRKLVAKDRVPTVVHGDYGPGNMFWDGRSLTVVDFERAQWGSADQDVTYFLHRLELFTYYYPWVRWPLERWRTAFLAGYEQEGGDRPCPLQMQVYFARHLSCRMLHLHGEQQSFPASVRSSWVLARVLRAFTGTVRSLAEQI
jgi:Ser/Thr protein kinase RdoA (MazF antagonist)